MPPLQDLIGKRFGRLVVLGIGSREHDRSYPQICRCDCDTVCQVRRGNLRSGNTLSCGCWFSGRMRELRTKHGQSVPLTREYRAWAGMKQRVAGHTRRNKSAYTDRGVTVCNEWVNDFSAFYRDMGECPDGLTLDRIDPGGNYCKENCRWTTWDEQHRNRRNGSVLRLCGRCGGGLMAHPYRISHSLSGEVFCSRTCYSSWRRN